MWFLDFKKDKSIFGHVHYVRSCSFHYGKDSLAVSPWERLSEKLSYTDNFFKDFQPEKIILREKDKILFE